MDNKNRQWLVIYRLGAICAFSALLVMLTEMFLTMLPDGAREIRTISELFEMYNRNWFMAMRYMGLINIIATTLMIPVFYSIYGVHREKYHAYAGIIFFTYIAGYAIFMADNSSFGLLHLSNKYELAESESLKSSLLAAGEALFAKGASHTPGTFPGFFIGELTSILFCVLMLNGKVFNRLTAIIGLIGFSFLFIFELCSSFIPLLYDSSMVLAMIGGTATLVWYVLVGLRLFKVSKSKEDASRTTLR